MQRANYHTHTNFSDGISQPEAYIEKAIELGLETIGFSDHAPIPSYPKKWNMPIERLTEYYETLESLKEKYKREIRVLTSLEIDYIPDIINPKSEFLKTQNLDYSIGSIHLLGGVKNGELWGFELIGEPLFRGLQEIYGGNSVKMIQEYYQNMRDMVQYYTPDIIGHLDKIKMINLRKSFFDEQENWYRDEVKETLTVIAEKKSVIEVNTKGMYGDHEKEPYPSYWILKMAHEMHIPIMLSSDAHKPERLLTGFKEIENQLIDIGYKEMSTF